MRMAAFRKLAGKIEVGSISLQELGQDFPDTDFHSHLTLQ